MKIGVIQTAAMFGSVCSRIASGDGGWRDKYVPGADACRLVRQTRHRG